jgi:Xaa-Pro aminopeptidase
MTRKTLTRTGPPAYPEHPEHEHLWRIDRIRRIMRDDHLDSLVLSRNVNVFYATGTRFVFVAMEGPNALSPQTTVIITQNTETYCQRFGAFDTDAVPIHTTWSPSIELYTDELELVGILADVGVGRGARVGIEWGLGLCTGINPLKFETLRRRILQELGAELVDSTPAMWKAMAIKSALEIGRMKIAVRAAARAMERTFDFIEIGMNELDVARQVARFMLEEGADSPSHAQVMSLPDGGERFGSCMGLDRPIGPGWVTFDIGATYRRYRSDINRGIFLGREPSAAERRAYACRVGANEVLDRTIKPGISFDTALAALQQYVKAEGFVLLENHGTISGGHGLGLENYQRPNLTPSFSMPEFQNAEGNVLFEPGMMFTYEMPIRRTGSDVFFNVEDDIVVTETGVENMSSMLDRGIRVKP